MAFGVNLTLVLITHSDIAHSQSGLGFEMSMLMSVSHYQKSQNGPSLNKKKDKCLTSLKLSPDLT